MYHSNWKPLLFQKGYKSTHGPDAVKSLCVPGQPTPGLKVKQQTRPLSQPARTLTSPGLWPGSCPLASTSQVNHPSSHRNNPHSTWLYTGHTFVELCFFLCCWSIPGFPWTLYRTSRWFLPVAFQSIVTSATSIQWDILLWWCNQATDPQLFLARKT